MPCKVDSIPCKYNCGQDNCDLSGYLCQAEKDFKAFKRSIKKSKSQFNERENYSNLLCEACALLEEHSLLSSASEELQNWYQNHESQEIDRLKKEALAKLSKREKRILGLE
jgi:hypothetical protein